MNHADAPQELSRCWAEIDTQALHHNVAAIRKHVGADVGIMAVIKANAYGHGAKVLAGALRQQVDMFGVASVAEGLRVQPLAPEIPIMVLSTALPEERETMVRSGFIPVISTVEEARAYAAYVGADAPPLAVHLAVDTGMGRIGVWQDEAVTVGMAISQIPGIRLSGVATHLPVADEDLEWTQGQLRQWESVVRGLRERGLDLPVVHSLNSAGIIQFGPGAAASKGDLVRAGLMLYGSSPLPEFQAKLRPVLSWKSRITLLRDVPEGRSVSYGRTYVTPRPMRIATVAVGYGDGYPRHLSNAGAEVLVGGQRCAILGRVTMDQILVDVSAVTAVAEGAEVVLLGIQGSEEISAAELANKAGTIPWEIFTGIGTRVVRRY
ncbi:MAG: alanine racemase [Verrucomicrobiota bacterium]